MLSRCTVDSMPDDNAEVKAAVLECQVNAVLAGHDRGPFDPVDTFEGAGYQVQCRRCGQTAWVGESGLMYSLLGDRCPNSHTADN